MDIEGVGRRDRQIQNWIGGTNRLAREWRKLRAEDRRRMTKVAAFEWWILARVRRWRVRSIRNMYLPHVLEAPRKYNRLLEAGLINVLQHCGVRAVDKYYSGLPEGMTKLLSDARAGVTTATKRWLRLGGMKAVAEGRRVMRKERTQEAKRLEDARRARITEGSSADGRGFWRVETLLDGAHGRQAAPAVSVVRSLFCL